MLFDFVMHLVIFSMNALCLRNFEIFVSVVSIVKVCLSAGDFGKLCQLFFVQTSLQLFQNQSYISFSSHMEMSFVASGRDLEL